MRTLDANNGLRMWITSATLVREFKTQNVMNSVELCLT